MRMAIEAVLSKMVKSVLFPRTPGLYACKVRAKVKVIRYVTVCKPRTKDLHQAGNRKPPNEEIYSQRFRDLFWSGCERLHNPKAGYKDRGIAQPKCGEGQERCHGSKIVSQERIDVKSVEGKTAF